MFCILHRHAPAGPQPGASWDNLTRISEFQVSTADANQAHMGSERVILEADHPYSNPHGGTIAFGHDGYLYIPLAMAETR